MHPTELDLKIELNTINKSTRVGKGPISDTGNFE